MSNPFAVFRFWLENQVLRGLKMRLVLAAIIIAGISLIAGALGALLVEDFKSPGEAVWWAFLRLTDPGYLGDDEGLTKRIISTIVTILGYILFLGLLIAILTQWLHQTIRRLESGVSRVALSDHVIILGWTTQTRAIAQAMLVTGSRKRRFLARHGVRDLHIVIMAEEIDDALRQKHAERFGEDAGRRVLLRAGTPLRLDHLERVNFRDAAVIILPGANFAEDNPSRVDSLIVKTLVSVSTFARQAGHAPPFAVAQMFDERSVPLASHAYDGESEAVSSDSIIGRLMAQSLRYVGLWSVLSEMLMIRGENSLHLRKVEGQTDQPFRDLRGRFSRAVLIGFVRPGEERSVLNPDPQETLQADDVPVFLARRFDDCVPDRQPDAFEDGARVVHALRPPANGTRRILLLGWSRKVPLLFRELERFGKNAFAVEVISSEPIKNREADLADFVSSRTNLKVKHIEQGFASPGVIDRLDPGRYDSIVVLASEGLKDKEHADAISVTAALALRRRLAEEGVHPQRLVEVLDAENLRLFQGGDEDVMASPAIVSYGLSQIALQRELAWVFRNLANTWGGQIILRNAAKYLGSTGSVQFEAFQRAAAGRGEIALGLRPHGKGLSLNPDRDIVWDIGSDDKVVVLTTFAKPQEDNSSPGG